MTWLLSMGSLLALGNWHGDLTHRRHPKLRHTDVPGAPVETNILLYNEGVCYTVALGSHKILLYNDGVCYTVALGSQRAPRSSSQYSQLESFGDLNWSHLPARIAAIPT